MSFNSHTNSINNVPVRTETCHRWTSTTLFVVGIKLQCPSQMEQIINMEWTLFSAISNCLQKIFSWKILSYSPLVRWGCQWVRFITVALTPLCFWWGWLPLAYKTWKQPWLGKMNKKKAEKAPGGSRESVWQLDSWNRPVYPNLKWVMLGIFGCISGCTSL